MCTIIQITVQSECKVTVMSLTGNSTLLTLHRGFVCVDLLAHPLPLSRLGADMVKTKKSIYK